MIEKIKWINFDVVEKFMTEVLVKTGVPENEAAICAEVLITADKYGIDSPEKLKIETSNPHLHISRNLFILILYSFFMPDTIQKTVLHFHLHPWLLICHLRQ